MDAQFIYRPLAAILVSAAGAVLILFSGRRPNLREFWTILAAFSKFGIILSLLPAVLEGNYPALELIEISRGVRLALKVDPLGISFALSASLLWILTSFYSIGYMRTLREHHQTRYFASFAACLSATVGIAFSANLLTFLIFYELLTIATYPLVIHKGTPAALAAGRKYLSYLLSGGVALLLAVGWTQLLTGSLEFSPGGFLTSPKNPFVLQPLFILFLIGVGTKAAFIPLHSWLPTAMIAPTPVSALLHAVAVVKAGVFGVARVVGFVFGPSLLADMGLLGVVSALAAATIVLASLLALVEDNLKLRLAYSTVGHLSYIILGTALLAPQAWSGALFHITAHAAMKITLFFCAGAIYAKTHLEKVSQLDGLGKQMPVTFAAFGLAALGLAGLPPLAGFISKWYLGAGAVYTDRLIYLAVLLLSGLLNAGYLFPIVQRAFFRPAKTAVRFDEASPFMVVPLAATASLSVMLGLFPNALFQFFNLASRVAQSVTGGIGLP